MMLRRSLYAATRAPMTTRLFAQRFFASGSSATPEDSRPEPKAGEIATNLEHVTGLQAHEYLGSLEGVDVFEKKPADHFGTLADPVVVYSAYDTRIVGCTSSNACPNKDEPGFLLWWMTKTNTYSRCGECGQVFLLLPEELEGAAKSPKVLLSLLEKKIEETRSTLESGPADETPKEANMRQSMLANLPLRLEEARRAVKVEEGALSQEAFNKWKESWRAALPELQAAPLAEKESLVKKWISAN
eukprot:NODE_1475_length_845_cov_293.254875_g1427_i0.p1 GENE.NODE_1475_length_845_cov_293.254875_g1427_i0~~NODE_1475_length_845_cov_293.254875_g1427_i0.p1  ORF type:complete len:273 (-),score=74.89 NODE_1475_length_845_cov_293.254875_g1427_i0:27-758(-)